jgi:acetyl/propionyl-CoA carboxylase alpha subunit
VEYLYDSEHAAYYFLEMNTRLQVEHPVTEAITGIDLVEWQLRIARGEALGFAQTDLRFDGHAIEVRIAAENPAENYRPETGTITLWAPPSGVRLDTGVGEGSVVGHHYDSMLAKLIVHAPDRAQAIRESVAAINRFAVGGVGVNLAFQRALLMHPDFAALRHHTAGLADLFPGGWTPPEPDAQSRALASLALHLHLAPKTGNTPWQTLGAWRLTAPAGRTGAAYYWALGDDDPTRVAGDATQLAMILPDCADLTVELPDLAANRLTGRIDGIPLVRTAHLRRARDHWQVHLSTPDGMATFGFETLADRHLQRASKQAGGADTLRAPMPGAVVELRVARGDRVAAGDTLVVLEAMKLLQSLTAPVSGTVAEIYCAPGDTVAGQAPLVKLDPEETP